MENNIIGDEGEPTANIQKRFWNHIKVTKKDRVGTAPLKENGLLISDSKCKATILNKQYQYVFSHENTEDIPTPTEPPAIDMPNITVSQAGVLKLLQNLKEHKASGPDQVPSRVLKKIALPVSHCLALIFNASLVSGIVPHD